MVIALRDRSGTWLWYLRAWFVSVLRVSLNYLVSNVNPVNLRLVRIKQLPAVNKSVELLLKDDCHQHLSAHNKFRGPRRWAMLFQV